MAKKNIDLAVVLHDDCDYKDWLVELKERFYSHRLKASCATNGYLYKLYAPLQANCPQLADNFTEDLYIADIQWVVAQSKNRLQTADDFKLLFLIPWDHHRRIIDKCKGNMDKALFFVRKTWENNWGRDVLLNWLDTDLYERDGKAIKMNCIWQATNGRNMILDFYFASLQEYDGTEMPLATYRRYMPWELSLE